MSQMNLNRRGALQLFITGSLPLVAAPVRAKAAPDAAALLRSGGCVLMLRHAQTDPGIGDPPGFSLAQCSTQRNLSQEGREQARRIGRWFAAQNLSAVAVQSSQWCRCKDTSALAFGQFAVLPALNSTFGEPSAAAAQTRALAARLRTIAAGRFEVWVTHQVNITALTGEFAGMGEAFVVRAAGEAGQVLASTRFEVTP